MPSVISAPILAHREVAPRHFVLTLHAPPIAASAQPGQFVQVRGVDWVDPLLPRPFSVMRAHRDKGDIEILYRVVGKGTALMTRWQPGGNAQVFGPLGKPFQLFPYGARVLIGGGVGIPPLLMLAEQCGRRPEAMRAATVVLQGARTADQLLCVEDFQRTGVTLELATDDGSTGHHGLVTDLLKPHISRLQARYGTVEVFTCGPMAMMRAVAETCRDGGVGCQVCLEAPMPCGFGVCMGCVVKVRGAWEIGQGSRRIKGWTMERHYKRVCHDGPVFDANEVVWDE
ncbi:MAG: dihydroorotate dehydrogenase electron transfer subunit [Abditibacteriales bacterium]|nr:dihydroorotate dehydrogenase electron transfer subunit [Abditibacteriales bacterium]MDW8364647.1 dihydroorotate dehydrogenase electron transfer subunit [Abditibacteriales bacterium]